MALEGGSGGSLAGFPDSEGLPASEGQSGSVLHQKCMGGYSGPFC